MGLLLACALQCLFPGMGRRCLGLLGAALCTRHSRRTLCALPLALADGLAFLLRTFFAFGLVDLSLSVTQPIELLARFSAYGPLAIRDRKTLLALRFVLGLLLHHERTLTRQLGQCGGAL